MTSVRGRGQGTKLSDGRWRVVVCRLVDGRPAKKSFTAKTQKEAQAKARAWTPKHQPDLTLEVFLKEWLKPQNGRISDGTYRSYALAVRLVTEKIGFVRLSKLLPKHLEDAYATINGSRLPKQVRTIMGTALEYARKNRYIDWNPALLSSVPKTAPAPERPILTQKDFQRIVDATETPLFSILWHFLAQTGLRPGKEALRVQKTDFYENDGWWVKVPDSKTPSGIRKVPISQELYDMVETLDGELWARITLRRVNDEWRRAIEKAGVAYTNPYQMRHFAATKLARRGAHRTTIAAFLGHADPRLADKYYVDVSPEDLRAAIE